jgi:hypothetical protein
MHVIACDLPPKELAGRIEDFRGEHVDRALRRLGMIAVGSRDASISASR